MSIPVICAMASDFFMFSSVRGLVISHPSFRACSIVIASGYPFAFPRSMVSVVTSGGICICMNMSFSRWSLPSFAK